MNIMNKFTFTEEDLTAISAKLEAELAEAKKAFCAQQLIRSAFAPFRKVKSTVIEVLVRGDRLVLQYMDEDNTTGYIDPTISLFSKFDKFADESIQEEALEYFADLKEFYAAAAKKKAHDEYQQASEAWEAKRKEAEVKEQLKKAEVARQSLINRTDHIADRVAEIKTTDQFYAALGYLVKHAKKVSAAMPDFLDSWFVKEFGDQPHTVVDSNKRTRGGFPMQWALSMEVSLDTNDNMPAFLMTKLSQQNKEVRAVANTEYIYLLASRFGLKFGKEQDIAAIRACIPADALASFELGYSM